MAGNDKAIRRSKIAVVVFVSLDVFLLILTGITSYYFSQEGHVNTSLGRAKFCLPCDDVRLHPDDIKEGIEYAGENGTQCCINDNSNLDKFVSYVAAHWFKARLNDENPNFTSCKTDKRDLNILKLVGKTEKLEGNNMQTIQWDVAHSEGINAYSDGHIFIHVPGLYNIYSQVIFQHDTNQTDNKQETPKLFTHTVSLKPFGSNDEYEKIILKSSNSECVCNVLRHNSTSNVGTSYQLSKGDKLSVRVHNLADILPSAHMNYFGIHKI